MFFAQFKNINSKNGSSFVNSQFIDEFSKFFLFLKPFKNLPLVICYIYNSFIFRFNNIFIQFNYICCFFGSCIFSASLFRSSNSTISSIVIESSNFVVISSFDKRFAFLLTVIPFHIYKQKNKYFNTKYKSKKYLSKLTFYF